MKKGALVLVVASGLLIGLSAISYTQQAGAPPGDTAKPNSDPANGGGVVVRRDPTPSGSRGVVERGDGRTGSGCATQTYQVPSAGTNKLTTVNVVRC
jgi:hypothetical protein